MTEWMFLLDQKLGKHEGREPEIQYHCPFCIDRKGSDSSKATLRVSTKKGKATCFRCDFRAGSVGVLLSAVLRRHVSPEELEALSAPADGTEAARLAQSVMGILYPFEGAAKATLEPAAYPDPTVDLNKAPQNLVTRTAWNYLKERGADAGHVLRHAIGYCSAGRYRRRLIFPVIMDGTVVYSTNRYCGDHVMKSDNPVNVDGHYRKEDCLLGFDRARGAKVVAITEGPFSMMAFDDLDDLGVRPVALMGKTISPEQVRLLKRLVDEGTEEFAVATDPDADEMKVAAPICDMGCAVRVTRVPLEKGDPWDDRAELRALWDLRTPPTLTQRVKRLTRYAPPTTMRKVSGSVLEDSSVSDVVRAMLFPDRDQ